ncbi:MAG TPA: MDR family MFS transporter [Xanthobacteraceae bacterium]|nr:MDR family MFS transporter [Xanthobacteraceae bacterium]
MKPSEAAAQSRAEDTDDTPGTTADTGVLDASLASGAPLTAPVPPESDQPLPARWAMSHAEIRVIIFGVMLAMFLAALNQTIIATALPTMGRDFNDFENLSWLVTSYLLTSTIAAPLYGKLSDIYGRRAVMLSAIGVFVVGSVMCAAAPNMLVLILARGLQGLGGGGIQPIAQAIVADAVAPRERGRWQAYMGAVFITAGVCGPVLGGFLAEHLHWSLIFWLNLPLGIAAAVGINHTLKRLPRHDRPHKLDLFGAALLMAASILLLLALTWGGTRFPWLSSTILGLIAGSALLSVAFSYRLTQAPEPFLPLPVLANPIVRMGTTATSCAVGTSIGLTIFMPLYYESVHGLSASDAGLALIPIAVMTTPGSMLSGRVMMYMRHYKWVPIVGLSLAIATLAVLIVWPRAPLLVVLVGLALIGLGIGTTFSVSTVSIQNAVSRFLVGTATGVMNFFRALVSALVVAIMGAIVLAGIGVAPQRGGGTGVETAAAAAGALGVDMGHVFRWVFVAAAIFLLLGLVAMIRMEERPLRGSEVGSGHAR